MELEVLARIAVPSKSVAGCKWSKAVFLDDFFSLAALRKYLLNVSP
jgi:hypothetical protein